MTVSVHEDQPEAMALVLVRGIELHAALGHLVQWISEDEARVPSASHQQKKYRVNIKDETCECWYYRRLKATCSTAICKHIIAAQVDYGSQVKYYIEKRHDSLRQNEIFVVMRVENDRETVVDLFDSCREAHFLKWELQTSGRVA